jgi:hypothetical protein
MMVPNDRLRAKNVVLAVPGQGGGQRPQHTDFTQSVGESPHSQTAE